MKVVLVLAIGVYSSCYSMHEPTLEQLRTTVKQYENFTAIAAAQERQAYHALMTSQYYSNRRDCIGISSGMSLGLLISTYKGYTRIKGACLGSIAGAILAKLLTRRHRYYADTRVFSRERTGKALYDALELEYTYKCWSLRSHREQYRQALLEYTQRVRET